MNKLYFSFVLLLSISVSFAQKGSFGMVNYTIPTGYTLIHNDNVLTYYKENKSTGAYCNFFIYKLMPGKSNAKQNFDWAWENLLEKPFKFSSTATIQPETIAKGWRLIVGTANFSDNGISTSAIQLCISNESSMQAVCILSNSESYEKEIATFVTSLDVEGSANGTTTTTPPVIAPGNANAPSPIQQQTIVSASNDKSPKPEVWMKSRFEYDMMKKRSETKYEWLAVYPDGKFNPYMPTEGYAGFYNNNKNWGSAKWNGGRLNVVDGSNNYYYDKKSATTMQSKFDSKPNYYKSKPVDGLRIEGAYTPYASLLPSDKNELQYLIWFYKDGSFDDRGIFLTDLKNPNAFPNDVPGKGKYTIDNYSIFLRYNDGHIKQLGFVGFLDKDPATVTDAYFIGRHLYYRKDKGYNNKLNGL